MERSETVKVGANVSESDGLNILSAVHSVNFDGKGWINPYGDGTMAENIMKIIS